MSSPRERDSKEQQRSRVQTLQIPHQRSPRGHPLLQPSTCRASAWQSAPTPASPRYPCPAFCPHHQLSFYSEREKKAKKEAGPGSRKATSTKRLSKQGGKAREDADWCLAGLQDCMSASQLCAQSLGHRLRRSSESIREEHVALQELPGVHPALLSWLFGC